MNKIESLIERSQDAVSQLHLQDYVEAAETSITRVAKNLHLTANGSILAIN